MKVLTQKRAKELLSYDPNTGVFVSAEKRNKWPAGRVLGHVNKKGYVQLRVDGGMYLAHRVAWLYMTGHFPRDGIDHIDRCKSNNAWSNLREANQAENNQNTSLYASNKSGRTGVSWHAKQGLWRAVIQANRRSFHLGYFDSVEAASAAYVQAKMKLHPFAHEADMGQAGAA